jgi:hypothetical protein
MANAFQHMLEQFGLTEKILGLNADNASANNKLTTKLSSLNNSFKEEYWAQCFNHTMQLSAKTLLKPFNTALSSQDVDITDKEDDDPLIPEAEEEGKEEDNNNNNNEDDEDDGIDELETLSEEERTQVLEDTVVVRTTLTKTHELEYVRLLNY